MILDRIVAHKKKEIEENKNFIPIDRLKEKCLASDPSTGGKGRFSEALRKNGEVALIAEVKKASPSKGLIRQDFNPGEIALIYSQAGASAISVLTDREFFQGAPGYLRQAADVTAKPLLRKDFIIDPYQIYEARLLGADAILLIMAILSDREALYFKEIAESLGLECLVEVHSKDEMARALALKANIIGINNRDLNTFKTDLGTTFRLREMIANPGITVVSESGINTRDDVIRLGQHGVHAMLVGEALMRETDIAKKIAQLLGNLPAGAQDLAL